jgi:hypothetical protein
LISDVTHQRFVCILGNLLKIHAGQCKKGWTLETKGLL